MKSPILEQFRALDYQTLAQLSADAGQNVIERYAILRAKTIISANSGDETVRCAQNTLPPPLAALIAAQIAGFTRNDLDEHFAHLVALQLQIQCLPSATFFQAELFFTLGFLCAQNSRYHQAISFQRQAHALYEAEGFLGQAGITLFNLSTNYSHLNENNDAQRAIQGLETLYQRLMLPALGLALYRVQGYAALHREEYTKALDGFNKAIQFALDLRRENDRLHLFIHMVHCLLKLGRTAEVFPLLEQIKMANFLPSLQIAATIFEYILNRGLITGDEAKVLFRKLCKEDVDPIARVFAFDAILGRLRRTEEWGHLLQLSRLAQKESTQLEQSPCLVDFRGYQVLALQSMGMIQDAERVYRAFEVSARNQGANERIKDLNERLNFHASDNIKNAINTTTIGNEIPTEIILDKSRSKIMIRTLTRGETSLQIGKTPTLSKLIQILSKSGEGGLHSHELFSRVFETSFHPELNEPRLASLIHRARKTLGSDSAIIRSDGKIMFHPTIRVKISGRTKTLEQANRRAVILRAITKETRFHIGLKEVAKATGFSKRTLQEDLGFLVRKGEILRFGEKKGARYQIARKESVAL